MEINNNEFFSSILNKIIQEELKIYSSNKLIYKLKKKFNRCSSYKNFKKIFNYYNIISFKIISPILLKSIFSFNFNLIFCDDNGFYYYYNKLFIDNISKKILSNYSINLSDKLIKEIYESYLSKKNIVFDKYESESIKGIVRNIKLYKKNLIKTDFIPLITNSKSSFSIYTGSSTTYSYSSNTTQLLNNTSYFYPNNSSKALEDINSSNSNQIIQTEPITYCAFFPFQPFFYILPYNSNGDPSSGIIANPSINNIEFIIGSSGGCAQTTSIAGASGSCIISSINSNIEIDNIVYNLSYIESGYNTNYGSLTSTWYDISGNLISTTTNNNGDLYFNNSNGNESYTGTVLIIDYVGNNTFFPIYFLAQDAYFNSPGINAIGILSETSITISIQDILSNIKTINFYNGTNPINTTVSTSTTVNSTNFIGFASGNVNTGTNSVTYSDNLNFISNGGTSQSYSFGNNEAQPTTNGFCGGGGTNTNSTLLSTNYPYSTNNLDPGTYGFAYVALS